MVNLLAIRLPRHVSTSLGLRIATKCSRTATDCVFLTLHEFGLVLIKLIIHSRTGAATQIILNQDAVLSVVSADMPPLVQRAVFEIGIHLLIVHILEHLWPITSVSVILNEFISGFVDRSLFHIYVSISHCSIIIGIRSLILNLSLTILLHILEHASLLCCLVVANGLFVSFFETLEIRYVWLHLFQKNQTKCQQRLVIQIAVEVLTILDFI